MKTNSVICDGCKKPIDLTKPCIEFTPLRGGLDLKLKTSEGEATLKIAAPVHLCGPECFGDVIAGLAKAIKPVKNEQPVAPGVKK